MMDGPIMGLWLSEQDWKRVLTRDLEWQAAWERARLCEVSESP